MKVNKHINLHITALFIFSSYYLLSLILFNSVVLFPHDNLENVTVYNNIISKIYRGDLNSFKLFLSGEFKWFYLDKVFYPINFFQIILSDKHYYFFVEILEKIAAYFSFYLFSKSFSKNKQYSVWGAILYVSLVNLITNHENPTIFLSFLPYIIYLIVIKKNIQLKHYVIIFFIGLNSSIIYDLPSLIVALIFCFFYLKNHNKKNFSIISLLVIIGIFISSIPSFLSILSEPTNRLVMTKANLIGTIVNEFSRLANNFMINDLIKLFFLPINLMKLFVLGSIIYFKNKKIRFFLFSLLFIYITEIILSSSMSQIIFENFLTFLKGYNFSRISNFTHFIYSTLLVLILSLTSNLKYKRLLIISVIFSSISLQIFFPIIEYSKEFLKQNLKEKSLVEIKKSYKNKDITNSITIVFEKNNYNFNGFQVKAANSFDAYYKFDIYKKIKNITGNSKVASIGVNPMIAVMNNIHVIDGYHVIYPLSYKKKFRKIIEGELNQNQKLKKYYDEWGNRLYLYFSDKNNLLINFKEAKKIGAEFIISSFLINNKNLQLACPDCNYSNELFLYRIL